MKYGSDYSNDYVEGMKKFNYRIGYVDQKELVTISDIRTIYVKDEITFYKLLDRWNNPNASESIIWKFWSV